MLTIDRRNGTTVARLEHGPVNALDVELLRAVTDAVRETSGPLVLTGAGRSFSAGVDLRRIVEEETGYTAALLAALSDAFLAVFDHPAPTVAAVNGHAIAGGCVLALACDFRLMTTGRIGLTELTVGVPFPAAALEIARWALGPAASRVVLGADTFEPDDAVRVGLVHELVTAEDLLDRAVVLAAGVAAHDAVAYALVKRQLHRPVGQALDGVSDEDVVRAWTSSGTRSRLAEQVARLRRG